MRNAEARPAAMPSAPPADAAVTSTATWRRYLVPSNLTILFAVAGIIDAGYLTYVHYHMSALVCSIGGCLTVQNSKYAEIFGFPIAILGLGMYIAIAGLWLIRLLRPALATLATMGIFGLALIGVMYAAYLTYIEIWVVKAICEYCVFSALMTLGILIVEGFAAYKIMMEVPEV